MEENRLMLWAMYNDGEDNDESDFDRFVDWAYDRYYDDIIRVEHGWRQTEDGRTMPPHLVMWVGDDAIDLCVTLRQAFGSMDFELQLPPRRKVITLTSEGRR